MSVSAMLVYNPPGPVLREVSFDIPIKCVLPRFFHSYKVGYYPLLTGGTFGLPLTPRTPFAIVAQDESGNTIAGGTSYTLGEQMFFEARRPAVTTVNPTQRLYIDKCVMTAGPSYISEPNHMVINNHGCMVDSKDTPLSKFLTANSQMVQKFSVAALVFKDAALTSSSQQLFMHCEISIAPIAATESFKACTYDQATQTWQELYGYHHTCACCDTTCPPGFVKASRNVVSSKSWKVNFKDEDGETEPQLTSLDGRKNEEMADQKGFINYWDD
ncbi:zona pellucida sperm-binding protein 3 [Synchiropus picturatus]